MPLKYTVLVLFISLISCLQSFGQNTQNWQLSQQYTPPDVRSNNLFGNAVDIDGHYAIASAHLHSPIINGETIKRAGAAYLFEKDGNGNWNEVQKLTAPDTLAYNYFGIDLAISGTTAIIGASNDNYDVNQQNFMPAAGAVYVYERDEQGTWQFWQKITASDRDTLDRFGSSLHIHHNKLMVSAPIKEEEALAVGCVYYFTKNEEGYWIEQQKIKPPVNKEYARFGSTLHFNNEILVVGAPLESGIHEYRFIQDLYIFYRHHGAAYIYELGENGLWTFSKKILSERLSQTKFGEAVVATTINNQSFVFVGQSRWIRYKQGERSYNTGGVHLYTKKDTGNWYLQETLTPTIDSLLKLTDFSRFGYSFSIDSNKLVVSHKNSRQEGFTIVADVLELKNNKWEKIDDLEIPQILNNSPNIVIDGNNILMGNNNNFYTFNYDVMPSVIEIPQNQYPIVYPNPIVNNELNINKLYYSQLKEIQINSINGSLLFYKNYKNSSPNKIPFQLAPGIYLLTAVDVHNNRFIQKIIKH